MIDESLLRSKIKENSNIVDILSAEDLIKLWEKKKSKDFRQNLGKAAKIGANYTAPVLDTLTAARMIKELGLNGRVILKTVKGKQYVIFKGYAGLRSIFTGTRYLDTNPKVVDMAIGKFGVNRSIAVGARLTIYFVVPIDIVNFVLNDNHAMSQLVGTIATDLAKVAIAATVAELAATGVAAVTTLAVGPLVVAIVVGLAVGFALEVLDEKYGVTDALVKGLSTLYDDTAGKVGEMLDGYGKAIIEKTITDDGFGGLTDALPPDFER